MESIKFVKKEPKMNVVYILCHKNLKYLERCYNTVINQVGLKYKWQCKIIINTMDKEFEKKAQEMFPNICIITKSNGTVGVGHNSVITEFLKSNYEYASVIDFDDILFPVALYQLEQLIDEKYDVATLCFNDKILHKDKIGKNTFRMDLGFNHCVSTCKEQVNLLKEQDNYLKNPWHDKVFNSITPARLILFNKNIKKLVPLYSVKTKLYDDMLCWMKIHNAELKKQLKVATLSSPDIYGYNSMNDQSATATFQQKDLYNEHKIFHHDCKKYTKFSGKNWNKNIKRLNWFKTSIPEELKWNMKERMNYELKVMVLFELNCLVLEIIKLKQKDKMEEAKINYKKIIDYYGVPETDKQLVFLREKLGIESIVLEELDLDDENEQEL